MGDIACIAPYSIFYHLFFRQKPVCDIKYSIYSSYLPPDAIMTHQAVTSQFLQSSKGILHHRLILGLSVIWSKLMEDIAYLKIGAK
jgi:hypothetical protein